jgi:hypothetical protein
MVRPNRLVQLKTPDLCYVAAWCSVRMNLNLMLWLVGQRGGAQHILRLDTRMTFTLTALSPECIDSTVIIAYCIMCHILRTL